jgi:hypothetical protein
MVRLIEEVVGQGVWCVEYEGVVRMKFYDEKGYQWAKRYIKAYYGVVV